MLAGESSADTILRVATYTIPKNAAPCKVIRSRAATPLVTNGRSGNNGLNIPCRTWDEAHEVCRKINEGDHNGIIQAGRPKR